MSATGEGSQKVRTSSYQARAVATVNTAPYTCKLLREVILKAHREEKKKFCKCAWRWVVTRLTVVMSQHAHVSNHCAVYLKITML